MGTPRNGLGWGGQLVLRYRTWWSRLRLSRSGVATQVDLPPQSFSAPPNPLTSDAPTAAKDIRWQIRTCRHAPVAKMFVDPES